MEGEPTVRSRGVRRVALYWTGFACAGLMVAICAGILHYGMRPGWIYLRLKLGGVSAQQAAVQATRDIDHGRGWKLVTGELIHLMEETGDLDLKLKISNALSRICSDRERTESGERAAMALASASREGAADELRGGALEDLGMCVAYRDRVVPILVEARDSADPKIRKSAMLAMSFLMCRSEDDYRNLTPKVIETLHNDPDGEVRVRAAWCLATSTSFPQLKRKLPNLDVRGPLETASRQDTDEMARKGIMEALSALEAHLQEP